VYSLIMKSISSTMVPKRYVEAYKSTMPKS
jgi:hypothetical protein